MAANVNRVFLMGNLTRDPELRYVPSGTAVASFTIAVNRIYNIPSGERKEETSFIRIVVWGRRAELCGEYLSKGSPVFVEGRLRSRAWETQEGQKRSALEVVANNIQFLRGGKAPTPSGPGTADKQVPADTMVERDVDAPGNKKDTDEVPF